MKGKSILFGGLVVKSFCILLVGTDILTKAILLENGSLEVSKVIGTIFNVIMAYYLWKGNNIARWLMVVFLLLGVGYLVWSAPMLPEDSVSLTISISFFWGALVYSILLMLPPVSRYIASMKHLTKGST